MRRFGKFHSRWVLARFRLLREMLRRQVVWPRFLPSLSVHEIYTSAQARYMPQALSIPHVLLVRAQSGDGDDTPIRNIYADATFSWDGVARSLTVVDVEGDHFTMLHDGFVDPLATAVLPYFRQDLGQTLTTQYGQHVLRSSHG